MFPTNCLCIIVSYHVTSSIHLHSNRKRQQKPTKANWPEGRGKRGCRRSITAKGGLAAEKRAQEDIVAVKLDLLRTKAKSIGNYVHDSVPFSDNEDNNEIIRKWAPEGFDENTQEQASLSHHEVLLRLEGYDAERGTKLVGYRGIALRVTASSCLYIPLI